jgi:hypothetical protein
VDVLKFFLWYMAGGIILYFVYGMRNSNLQHGEPQDDRPDLPAYPEDARPPVASRSSGRSRRSHLIGKGGFGLPFFLQPSARRPVRSLKETVDGHTTAAAAPAR